MGHGGNQSVCRARNEFDSGNIVPMLAENFASGVKFLGISPRPQVDTFTRILENN